MNEYAAHHPTLEELRSSDGTARQTRQQFYPKTWVDAVIEKRIAGRPRFRQDASGANSQIAFGGHRPIANTGVPTTIRMMALRTHVTSAELGHMSNLTLRSGLDRIAFGGIGSTITEIRSGGSGRVLLLHPCEQSPCLSQLRSSSTLI